MKVYIKVICILILIISLIKIAQYQWEAVQQRVAAEQAKQLMYYAGTVQPPMEQIITPIARHTSHQHQKEVQLKFKGLLSKYPDFVGWITIDGTIIDYPVVQGKDNVFYLSHGMDGETNKHGAIFMDYRNTIQDYEKHFILYGHNMKNNLMFGELNNYADETFLERHPIIKFQTLYHDYEWEIFSVYYTDVHDDYIKTDFISNEAFQLFLDKLKDKSIFDMNKKVTNSDIILTLSTCYGREAGNRFVVHAKLMD